ncbi:acetate--CoA ligase family protein [Mangrovibacterium diazotrophicum]|uniref:Acetyltransferase n=1 Tax=Mangrovibacterium diazotrophicum TaxID=1261403 RepID=A0A419VVX8_9BACT|nr:acetate--CoA ligase family protein [Mangrovibacterium diazotrophicum]RKD86314.1 acetyltransferase [Mangrovibacterium diazotrophicum]
MLNQALLQPKSIVVVGASNNAAKPGGHLLSNLIQHQFNGDLYTVNPRETLVQGVPSFASVNDLPEVDLAFLAIPAALCIEAVEILAGQKKTRAFVIISAGFGEGDDEGKRLEMQLLETVLKHNACLIGPNCVGLINSAYAGVFTSPVPALDPQGIDFVSGSGATAVFTLEAGMSKGLRFASVFSVGNSAQIGVEEVLQYWDENFDAAVSPRVKLLYLESIRDPRKLLKYARSLVLKGCRIAGVKAGVGESGARAAQSHTGALASSDLAVEALFQKAGIIRCHSREELTTVGGILLLPELKGSRLAIITHAGGPAVMMTDALEKGGFLIPRLVEPVVKEKLKSYLHPGSSVENPIDFLATGTAEQLGFIIDVCDAEVPEVDAMVVIFGSPGLIPVNEVYRVLAAKMKQGRKPIFPVLPSVVNAREAIDKFISSGQVCFPGEVDLANALIKVQQTAKPEPESREQIHFDRNTIQRITDVNSEGFLKPEAVGELLDQVGIPRVKQNVVETIPDALLAADDIGFPLAMKVIGPVHKTDVGGVKLDVERNELINKFKDLMAIPGATGVLLQQMAGGLELFIGAKREEGFDPIVLFGMGGVWLEVMKDLQFGLAPLTLPEVMDLLTRLKSFPLLIGHRGNAGINISVFAELIVRVGQLMLAAPEIQELDINPILASGDEFNVVDVRIRTGR